jgi:hypothetical protein
VTADAGRTRRRRLAIAGLVLFAVLYVGLLVLYAVAGKTQEVHADIPDNGVRVTLRANDVDGQGQRLLLDVDLDPSPALLGEGQITLSEPVTVVIDPSGSTREVTFAAGQIPAVVQIPLVLDGDIRNWPFDHYDVPFVVGAFAGTADSSRALDVTAAMTGRVQGWKLTFGSSATPGIDGGTFTFGTAALRRSGDVLVFAAILLGVLVMLPVLALYVAARTYFGRRELQPTLLSWMGAMLFATIPLRNFLPGSPPPGAWVDAVIVLWVIVGLVTALALYVLAWRQQKG